MSLQVEASPAQLQQRAQLFQTGVHTRPGRAGRLMVQRGEGVKALLRSGAKLSDLRLP